MEFTVIKSRAMTLSRSPQCRAYSRAVMDEKLMSPLFVVGEGGVVVTKIGLIHAKNLSMQSCLSRKHFLQFQRK